MINLGTSTMQDFALGDNLVERIDLGDTTIFDPYTTITGTLPLSFNSRASVALKNYRIHGTSEGAGVETENLHNVQTDLLDYRITWATGALIQSQGSSISDYIPVIEGQTYSTNMSLFWIGYDSQQTYLGAWNSNANIFVKDGRSSAIDTLTIPNGCQYIRLLGINMYEVYMSNINFVKGSTAPTTYIPYGYKIPILLNITKTEYSATSGTIEQGRYSTNQGSEITGIADTTKIRLSSYTLVSYNDTLVIDASVRANIDCSIIFTDVNNVVVNSTAWVSLPYTRTINYKNVKKCYVVFCKTNDSSISPSDVGTVAVTYKPVNSSNYDLFLGDSKLGEEEYLDFGEQKIYRTILLTTHDNKDFITSDNKRFCVRRSDNA